MRKVIVSSTVAAGFFLAGPQIADAALGDQTLRVGMTHQDVTELQNSLKEKGYFTGQATGYFGPVTEGAVRRFQSANNLTADGIAGPQTFSALKGSSVSTATSSPQTAPATTSAILRRGANSSQVGQLQQALKDKGYYSHSITNIYGAITEEAVRKFQAAHNLTADGIAGPQTFAALGTAPSAPSNTNTNNTSSNNTSNTTAPSTPSSTTNSSLLRQGSTGNSVTQLQDNLRSLGFFNQNSTGTFGSVTAQAVRTFQVAHNLTADGVAGPKTLSKIDEVLKNPTLQQPPQQTSNNNQSNVSGSTGAFLTNIVANASNYLGSPYLWGGTTASGFDCSGFIQTVFRDQGLSVPRTAAQQWNAGKSVSQPSVGDIVFFETYTNGPSHNGIYIGNNQFIHSGSSTGVTITSMSNSYWAPRYIGAKRLH
ncbi:peptidoglycan-binding protein [Alkalihalophilus pseudofirmus]|jgi:peptidoglycan hydrolase-like protein with peptidoglycan-binding domain|uniref:Peptidoglycan-binding protein n=1 Tax=Alkalihalophilus pseudofirmus TaxID=79885 RepID=A0AAJ2NQ44_ALKPS|nr:peptidoglycan-binding protein [Alkalihalophilus pseudofirmus]MDV2886391.1 peptidoglycan-binding protein [Alkalihalophilus pseudofirmus]